MCYFLKNVKNVYYILQFPLSFPYCGRFFSIVAFSIIPSKYIVLYKYTFFFSLSLFCHSLVVCIRIWLLWKCHFLSVLSFLPKSVVVFNILVFSTLLWFPNLSYAIFFCRCQQRFHFTSSMSFV